MGAHLTNWALLSEKGKKGGHPRILMAELGTEGQKRTAT